MTNVPIELVPSARRAFDVPWVLARAVAIVIGSIFLFAGFQKAVDTTPLARVLVFDGLQGALPVLLVFIPLWEIFIGAGLLVSSVSRLFLVLAAGTLLVFTVQLLTLYASADAPDCGCSVLLSKHADSQLASLIGVCRNAIMLTAIACAHATLTRRVQG